MCGLCNMALTWTVEADGRGDLSHNENVKNGQIWVRLFWECNFANDLKEGKKKTPFHSFGHVFI